MHGLILGDVNAVGFHSSVWIAFQLVVQNSFVDISVSDLKLAGEVFCVSWRNKKLRACIFFLQ